MEFEQNIHALGVNYMCCFLDRVGFTIHHVNRDPNHHFQIFAQVNDRAMLIAVRTACHPDVGTIDKAIQEELIKMSEHFKAVPHFAGLSLALRNMTDNQVDGIVKGGEYNVIFNGMTVVRQLEIDLCDQQLKTVDNTSDINLGIQ